LVNDKEYIIAETRKDLEALKEGISLKENEHLRIEEVISSLRDEISAVYDSIPSKISSAAQALQRELENARREKKQILEEKTELERQLTFSKHENLLVRNTLKDIDRERLALKKLLAEYKDFENLTGKIEEP